MELKYTRHFLSKLEDLFAESDYMLRYEKGNFKAGYCVLKDMKVVVVNKYYALEGKVNCLYEILRTITIDTSRLSEKNQEFLAEIQSQEEEAS
ncbi:hypothetical protein I5M27_13180 [Adhaeribacter sp. BT258]|uniref:Uncharacterized protein n=1 Tax=Adhaeribacter terrigena TaxID=2793070 RepID=A0ABS1C444_9BACT|nr:hypothetical protein [Adhaeribacter terrigena]MBK0403942.1 hypothetical protein [Adhaeribacter terrigena]